jgi:transposase-like protein
MRYEKIRNLRRDKFRRRTGIKYGTFSRMVEILNAAAKAQRSHGGRNTKLPMEDRLLLTLEYLREYRTYFHIAHDYGISESTAYKNVKWVEDTLIKHPEFSLPGRKALAASETEYEIVLVDSTESPIERPKKSRNTFIPARKNGTRSKAR